MWATGTVAVRAQRHKRRRHFEGFGPVERFGDFGTFNASDRRWSRPAGRDDIRDVKPSAAHTPRRPRRVLRGSGYDRAWWGEAARLPRPEESYWARTRRPLFCLAFVLPILVVYEAGVAWIGGEASASLRTGADAWMRLALGGIGLTDRWLPPLGLVLALLVWTAADAGRGPSRLRPWSLLGMLGESLALGVLLIGLSRLVDLAFLRLEPTPPPAAAMALGLAPLVGFLGAGVYEEALFRLALVPLLNRAARLLQAHELLAGTLAVTGSSLLFSIAHHAGLPGEPFTWYAFIFRWLAGVYFAWVFLARGFGVAVGTHVAYDIFVGWFGWRL